MTKNNSKNTLQCSEEKGSTKRIQRSNYYPKTTVILRLKGYFFGNELSRSQRLEMLCKKDGTGRV